jgi:hypothetical protein
MGNNPGKYQEENDENIDYLADFFGKSHESQPVQNYSDIVKKLKKDLINKNAMMTYNKHIEVFVDPHKGLSMPYESDIPSYEKNIVSDNPKYIELVICKNNMKDIKERFNVEHPCKGGDCGCTTKIYDVNDPFFKRKPVQMGGADDDDDDDDDELALSDSDEDDNGEDIPKKKKKQNKEKGEDDDDDDDDDEDLDIDDEDITEDGLILENSDITSSDLYKMQRNYFRSNTISDYSEDGFTDAVEKAMDKGKSKPKYNDKLFDTEDRNILDLSSSSGLNKRPKKRNSKYY